MNHVSVLVPSFSDPVICQKKYNALHGVKLAEPPIEWNNQPPSVHSKFRIPAPNTSSMVSTIMVRLNHNEFYKSDVDF